MDPNAPRHCCCLPPIGSSCPAKGPCQGQRSDGGGWPPDTKGMCCPVSLPPGAFCSHDQHRVFQMGETEAQTGCTLRGLCVKGRKKESQHLCWAAP